MRRLPVFLLCAGIVAHLAACHSMSTTTTQNVTVTVNPLAPTLNTFGKQPFTATVTGSTNTALTWRVNGVTGGNATTGTISSSGTYSAPHFISGSIIPSDTSKAVTVTITAVSQADPAAMGTATVTLLTQGQNVQTGAIELGTSGSNIHAAVPSGNTITCCGGTLGSLLVRNGTNYILSNNHVLANSDAGHSDPNGATGDAIIQPGLIDNPAPNTCTSTGTATVANLTQFFTLEGNPPNAVDAAIALIMPGKVDTSGNILLLGSSADTNGVPVPGAPHAGSGVAASVNMAVAKSGRTTGLTCSTVNAISLAVNDVAYFKTCGGSQSFTVNYTNQISVLGGNFSIGGDSGSLIVTRDTADPVALLYAGSDMDTVGNPIEDVLLAMADSSNHVPTVVGGATHKVIGCTLPGPNIAQKTVASISVAQDAMQAAIAARDTHAAQVLGLPGVRGLGVGPSLDDSGQAAVIIFVAPGTVHRSLPLQLDGVRTRIVETSDESARGIWNAQDTQALAPEPAGFTVTSLSAAETTRAKAAHAAHVDEWMKQPGVQGFGVSSSADSQGEASLIIFLIRGVTHHPIPAEIDGVRTRVRESSRFHAGLDGLHPRSGCAVNPAKNAAAGARKIALLK